MEISRREEGYCGKCGRPAFVGYVALPGWVYRYPVCGACLGKMQADLSKAESEMTAAGVATQGQGKNGEDRGSNS